jgi:flavin reductase (DIM6/NTAB) family NADH-FMN oxidoreductase RutF
MDPPSLLICVNKRNRSLDAIKRSAGFVVNLLRAGRHEISDLFASPSADKFDGTDWRPSPASGLPLLAKDALAFVDCSLCSEIHAGSHAVLIGQVRESGFVEPSDGPLVYWRRNYGQWSPPIPEAADMPDIYA